MPLLQPGVIKKYLQCGDEKLLDETRERIDRTKILNEMKDNLDLITNEIQDYLRPLRYQHRDGGLMGAARGALIGCTFGLFASAEETETTFMQKLFRSLYYSVVGGASFGAMGYKKGHDDQFKAVNTDQFKNIYKIYNFAKEKVLSAQDDHLQNVQLKI